jgi:hypothetical protein
MMSTASGSTGMLIRLIIAHVLADFLAQPASWITERRERTWKSSHLYLHGAIAAAAIYAVAWRWSAVWLIPVVFCSHVVIDGIKSRVEDSGRAFALDQMAHVAVLLGCWMALSTTAAHQLSAAIAGALADPRVWLVALSYISVFWPAAIVIGKATAPLRIQTGQRAEEGDFPQAGGLPPDMAGLWIGRIERLLILTFVLIGHFEAIGFLIAAKSMAVVFGGRAARGREMSTDYLLIGTLLSFTLAVGVGLGCYYAVRAMTSH